KKADWPDPPLHCFSFPTSTEWATILPAADHGEIRLTCRSHMVTIVRAQVAHTPSNPFVEERALHSVVDGALAFSDGRIVACGPWSAVSRDFADAVVVDARDALLLPGFVDCHVHYPQIRIIGAMGLELMDWLRERALPEEARLADSAYAAEVAS